MLGADTGRGTKGKNTKTHIKLQVPCCELYPGAPSPRLHVIREELMVARALLCLCVHARVCVCALENACVRELVHAHVCTRNCMCACAQTCAGTAAQGTAVGEHLLRTFGSLCWAGLSFDVTSHALETEEDVSRSGCKRPRVSLSNPGDCMAAPSTRSRAGAPAARSQSRGQVEPGQLWAGIHAISALEIHALSAPQLGRLSGSIELS